MSKKRIHAHIVLDRSSSMNRHKGVTISSFNEYVATLGLDKAISARVGLSLFDSVGIDIVHDGIKAKDVALLTEETYKPRGGTPLYDAIGKTVEHIEGMKLRKGEQVALVILTDGEENSSVNFTAAQIKKLLTQKQENDNWLVIYLGANQDAWAVGAQFGVSSINTMTFDQDNTRAAYAAAARGTISKALSGSNADAAFTTSEMDAASQTKGGEKRERANG